MRHLFFVMMLIASSLSFAHAEESATEPAPQPEALINLERLDQEIVELNQEAKKLDQNDQEIIRLQILKKNDERREQISALFKDRDGVSDAVLMRHVQKQLSFINGAKQSLKKIIAQQKKAYANASDEQKLQLLKEIDESERFYITFLESDWKNTEWLAALKKNQSKNQEKLRNEVTQQLEFVSAGLVFDLNEQSDLKKEMGKAGTSEQTHLEMMSLINKRKIANKIGQIRTLIGIAESMDIDASVYKQQLIQETGDLSQDLLDVKVAFNLVTNAISGSFTWIRENAPQTIFKLVIFVFILLLGRFFAKITRKIVQRTTSSSKLQLSKLMQEFFISMSGKAVFFIALLIALSQIGLNLAPILTGFGIAGVIIGFALQDTLSNFAAGMMLLIYRPFDVGDLVVAGGVEGKVSHMSLVNTTIRTFDNQVIILPNNMIWGDVIKNVTHERVRRVDMVFGVGYGDDIPKVEQILNAIVSNHEKVLKSPEPTIRLHVLNASSVDFIVRPWVKTDDYWDVYWDITREVKMQFDAQNVSIPFPQQDVHLHMVKES
ncbi:hypothetical protein VST7929_01682 [Vibrio stylophorae]|uniref:Small-conductance mechanosensitive channel n=1 Tax=Vibrio stylophorae TaxID=659351 RepID=A0ABN8DSY1_9VIBR|nr:mechanosensitive ion channel domain-containing protein [Vibrio stylophorae]CAH0533807.1 hypothetical protein VST7929_01682 [Vibrio stylophorae]